MVFVTLECLYCCPLSMLQPAGGGKDEEFDSCSIVLFHSDTDLEEVKVI